MPNNRTRGLLPPDPRRLGEEPLAAGEASEVVRVRAQADTLADFRSLSAAERGVLIARALAGL